MTRPRSSGPSSLCIGWRGGQPGIWDGVDWWSREEAVALYRAVVVAVTAAETRHPPGDPLTLCALWFGWGQLGRLLIRLGSPPDPPVPHRLEIIAPSRRLDSMHCWTCDQHIERPLIQDVATLNQWFQAAQAFGVQHTEKDPPG